MLGAVGAVVLGALAASVMVGGVRPVLRRLPEPRDAPEDKTPYAGLPDRRFVAWCAVSAAVATVGCALLLPTRVLPLWFVLSTAGVLLAAIDARTTWLPLPLTRLTWVVALASAVLGVVLASATGANWSGQLVGTGAGAAAAGALYWGVWAITRGGFGFGDVRFAPLVGAATGACSFTVFWWALALGSLAGAGYGLVRLARGRRGPFPYAPAILAGGYLAVTADWLLT